MEATLQDYQLLCYLLIKRLGGSVTITNEEMGETQQASKHGRLHFSEGAAEGDLVIVAVGN